jgi:4,5-dihydroxyphthalate decarboxylase
MSNVPITIATGDYDRIRAVREGRVVIGGTDMTYLLLDPEEMFFRTVRYKEFDVVEMSFSTYIMQRQRGITDYIAVPVFLSRVFRHSGFYICTDRGIRAPADLKGKRVGVPEYQMTAAVWQRGLLQDEYGVAPREIVWRTGGLEQPGREERSPLPPLPGVDLAPIPAGKTLSSMLEAGELDAVLAPRAPSCLLRGAPNVARLFPDYRTAEQAYYKKTRLHPIMHVLGLRQSLAERYPWLPANLFKAFHQAKEMAVAELEGLATLKVTLPWAGAELAATRELMGRDIWPYGFGENRREIETLIRYSFEQGLISQPVAPEELFAASTLSVSRV